MRGWHHLTSVSSAAQKLMKVVSLGRCVAGGRTHVGSTSLVLTLHDKEIRVHTSSGLTR